MKLSELKTGECGIIEKVAGHGGFRKRIIEMGFIKGKIVEVLLNAPLEDPVKYKIMGYEVSLRHSEADQITVRKTDNLDDNNNHDGEFRKTSYTTFNSQNNADSSPVINVALVGNPNCGKTSLFNFISVPMNVSVTILVLPLMPKKDMPTLMAIISMLLTCLAHIRYQPIRPKNCMFAVKSSTKLQMSSSTLLTPAILNAISI